MDKLEKARQLLSTEILQNFIGRITGSGLERIVGSNPENVLLVGKLMSAKDSDGANINSSKTFIESIGTDFYLSEADRDTANIRITPQGDFYYRVYPLLEEQREAVVREIDESKDSFNYTDFSEVIVDYEENPEPFASIQLKLVPVYKKVSLSSVGAQISFRLKDILDDTGECGFIGETHTLNSQLKDFLQELQSSVNADPETMLRVVTEPTKVSDLYDERNFATFLRQNANSKVEQQNQNWQIYFDIQVKKIGTNFLVSTYLVNNSIVLYSNAHRSRKDDKFTIETLFNSGIRVDLEGAKFCSIELDSFADDYKYDKTQYALSNRCLCRTL